MSLTTNNQHNSSPSTIIKGQLIDSPTILPHTLSYISLPLHHQQPHSTSFIHRILASLSLLSVHPLYAYHNHITNNIHPPPQSTPPILPHFSLYLEPRCSNIYTLSDCAIFSMTSYLPSYNFLNNLHQVKLNTHFQ